MDVIKIALMGVAACLLALQLKKVTPEYELLITLGACLCIFFFLLNRLELVLTAMNKMQSYIKMDSGYLVILMKIIGITYVSEFSSSLCKDAGYGTIAAQIEMFGKISILAVSMPVLLALLEMIGRFLG